MFLLKDRSSKAAEMAHDETWFRRLRDRDLGNPRKQWHRSNIWMQPAFMARLQVSASLGNSNPPANVLCWSERGNLLAAVSDDNKIKFWDVTDTRRYVSEVDAVGVGDAGTNCWVLVAASICLI